jgi:hypothetical protein
MEDEEDEKVFVKDLNGANGSGAPDVWRMRRMRKFLSKTLMEPMAQARQMYGG